MLFKNGEVLPKRSPRYNTSCLPINRTAGQDRLEQTLRNRQIIPQRQVIEPSRERMDDGVASSWLHRYHRFRWSVAHSPPTTIKCPLKKYHQPPTGYAECKSLATLAHHSRQQLYGDEPDIPGKPSVK